MSKIDELKSVLDNREEGYGDSLRTLTAIAGFWTDYLQARGVYNLQLQPEDVAELMVLMKVARSSGKYTPGAHDDRLDIAGYGILAAEMADTRLDPTE